MLSWDVAVVGAGIAGAAVAWGCARRGARVVVV
ncbi:MAG TPA: NAD(P)-binding protein, partial [Candidatus Dormibacteraeota bacterium]